MGPASLSFCNNYDADGNDDDDGRNSNNSFFYIPQLKPRCTHAEAHAVTHTHIDAETHNTYMQLAGFFNGSISINALLK
jgi:hypothetical protein